MSLKNSFSELLSRYSVTCFSVMTSIHRRMGRGGWGGGGLQPLLKFWAAQIFWAEREIWAKPVFKEVSMFGFFEEIDIFSILT